MPLAFDRRLSLRRPGVLLVVVVLGAAFLTGCQRPAFLDEELPDDGPPIATSSQAALRFVEKVTTASQTAVENKRLSITLTQEEVTSFLDIGGLVAEQMQALGMENLEDLQQLQGAEGLEGVGDLGPWLDLLSKREGLPRLSLTDLGLRVVLQDPQVYFKNDGQIIARGYAAALGQRQPVRLVFAPRAAEGELILDFVEGNLGPFDVPEVLVDKIGSGLARAILAGQEFVEITRVEVGGGTLTLSGRYTG